MKIEVSSDILKSSDITANQYCYLYEKILFSGCSTIFTLNESEINDLEIKGFIKTTNYEIVPREKAHKIFELNNKEKIWYEFKSNYPIKQGSRRLHDNQEKCKKKYLELVKNNPELHKQILKGLENEQLARNHAENLNQFFPSWKMMSVWLNQKNWEVYLDYKEEYNNTEDKTEGI